MKRIFLLTVSCLLFTSLTFGQFGRNKVQYRSYTWYYIQTTHFDIYFTEEGAKIAEFTADAAETALASIQRKMNYRINNRLSIILYNSQNDFQETNIIDENLSEGTGGFTELFKNRVVLPFTGSYKLFRHVIHHELVHAVMNDMFYGGSIQNIISNNISIRFPLWFSEGLAEYISLGWDTNTDMFIRDAATSVYLPDINNLDGYFAYRGGQAVFYYIAKKYGEEKIGEILNKIKSKGNVEAGFQASIGLNFEELNERWKKEIKREFWPEIALRKDPDEFAKRLTDHRKDGGFYNTSPAISPQGDLIAFISNRDYYFDLYLMDANSGEIKKRLIKGNRSADFEELNILTPGLTWSPDNKKVALSAKRNGSDVIYIINVENSDVDPLPFEFGGIGSVSWSPDSKFIAFSGHTPQQSDIYLYEFSTSKLFNLTNDIFSDFDPVWSPDSKRIYFSSDRGDNLVEIDTSSGNVMSKINYSQTDLYFIEVESKEVVRITDTKIGDESSPVVSQDGSEILFISDRNGINNIYRKKVDNVNSNEIIHSEEIPVTNSLNGLNQLSLSNDGKKLVFSSMYQSAYNIFLLNNPFDLKTDEKELKPTPYISSLINPQNNGNEKDITNEDSVSVKTDSSSTFSFFTGNYVDTVKFTQQEDYSGYIFGRNDYESFDSTSSKQNDKFELSDNIDEQGNFRLNKYKISFSPDIVYADAGYNTLYGLIGTTIISFSDVLGDHRIIGMTSLQIDLKNSDYGAAYYYLPKRIDLGISAFHTARFVFLNRGSRLDLFRFRNISANVSFSYPINRYYRFEGGLSLLTVSVENLDNPTDYNEKATFFLPMLSFVHDNSIWGYTAPIDGSRYRFDLYGNPLLQRKKLEFYTFLADYRDYTKFWGDYSFAYRFSGGLSNGVNKQRFFLGGIENWINRQFATGDIPIESASDFAFLTSALPLRGYKYAERIGSKFALLNAELRFPLIRYLLTGGLPLLFRDVMGSMFIDAGMAWDKAKQLQLFTKDELGSTTTKDLLIGTGFGWRIYFLYFLLRFDVAWAYNFNSFSEPMFYFSLGTDF